MTSIAATPSSYGCARFSRSRAKKALRNSGTGTYRYGRRWLRGYQNSPNSLNNPRTPYSGYAAGASRAVTKTLMTHCSAGSFHYHGLC